MALTSRLMKDKALIGEFSQAAVRSSAAILGVALSTNIYGDAGWDADDGAFRRAVFQRVCGADPAFSPLVEENGRLLQPERDGGRGG